jgi:hypothetical protein
MSNDNKQKNTISSILDSMGNFATLDEVTKVIGDVVKTFSEAKKLTDKDIKDIKDSILTVADAHDQKTTELSKYIDNAINNLSTSSKKELQNEAKRLEKLLTDIQAKIPAEIKIDTKAIVDEAVAKAKEDIKIPSQQNGEDFRNALEALNGDDRLDISAIKGIKDMFDKLPKADQTRVMAANRYLYEMLDVDASGITDGQLLAWNASLNTWLPITASGTGTMTNLATGTGIIGGPITTTGTIALDPSIQPILDFTGNAGKILAVNVTEDAVEYISAGSGSGDVVGPASATDNAVARFDSTTGKLIQNSAVTIADTTGDITGGKYNKVTVTAPATGSTLTIADGKTLTANGNTTLGLAGITLDNSGGLIVTASKVLTISDTSSISGTNTGDNATNSQYSGLAASKEDVSNKATDFTTINNTLYPTVQAVNNAITTAVTGLLDYRGTYDASTNLFPATGGSGIAGAVLKGDFWMVSVAGTLGGTAVTAGDLVIALVDTPAQTASNWDLVSHNYGFTPVFTDQTTPQTIGATGARLAKLWATDLAVTNTITGSVSGNAATVTTNANLTGPITSVGNATSIASQTGTGTKFVVDNTPTLITPVLGVATATSVNKVAITAPATSATLTISDGKTLTQTQSITHTGTDSTTMTYPTTSATLARTDAAQTFTGTQTFSGNIISLNNAKGYTTTATSSGTLTLSASSTYNQYLTGSAFHTVQMPVVSTLTTGHQFRIVNNSTAAINVNSSGTNFMATVAPSTELLATCILTSGTDASSWSVKYSGIIGSSATSLTVSGGTGSISVTAAKTLTATNTLTLSGTDSTTMTFPSTSATIARTDAANTFTGAQTFSNAVIYTNNAITASGNAATVPITAKLNTVTNNSAATLTITMTTTSATDGQMTIVRVLDSSAAAQTITWVNTENSTVSAPTTSNGSTTLPLTVGFMYNSATSKWRCIAKA